MDSYDAVFDNAFSVVIPPNVPTLGSANSYIRTLKADWLRQAEGWLERRNDYRQPLLVSGQLGGCPSTACELLKDLVGASGFEPPASWSRTRRSTRLSHAPILSV